MSDPEELRPSNDVDDEADRSIAELLRRLAEAFVELLRRLVAIFVAMVSGGVKFFAAKRGLVIHETRLATARNRVDEDRKQERERARERERERERGQEQATKKEQKPSQPREVGLGAPPILRSGVGVGQRVSAPSDKIVHTRIAVTRVAVPFRHPFSAPMSKPSVFASQSDATPKGVPPFRPDGFRTASEPHATASRSVVAVPPFRAPRPPEQDPLTTPNPRPRGMGR